MNKEDIIEKYKNGVKLKVLANENNCTTDKIRYFLKKEKIWNPSKPYKYKLPEEEIISLYKNDIPVEKIAKQYNVSISPIVSILKKYNVRKPNWLKNLPYNIIQKVLNKEYIVSLFDEHVTQTRVIEELGCGQEMVVSLCKYHDIEIPNGAIQRSIKNRKYGAKYELTKDNFIMLYEKERLSICKIASLFGISINYLKRYMKEEWKYVFTRTPYETRTTIRYQEIKNNPEKLQDIVNEGRPLRVIARDIGCCVDSLCKLVKKHNITLPLKNISFPEKEITELVKNNSNVVETSNTTIITPYELDIVIPDKFLAIEYCGLYWHSEKQNKGKTYHLRKLELCKSKGIRLLTIFEDEYLDNPILVNNRILHILGIFNGKKINGRDCTVKEISSNMKKYFLNKYHLQGNDMSKIYLGLYYGDILVSVMTFSRPNRSRASTTMLRNNNLWELNRYATDYNYIVRGGAGKLLSYFKKNYPWGRIYSYADRRWSEGEMYYSLGFELENISNPNYWYVYKGYHKREYRYKYTKQKLVSEGFDKNLTEREIMEQRNYTRIWDCGMLKFTLVNR